MQDLQLILKHFGLSSLEVRTYLTLLEIGSAPVSVIARKGHLKRTNMYNVLSKLEQRGLVSEFQKGSVRYFQATEPEKLLYLQEQNKKKIELNIAELRNILPLLEGMRNPLQVKPRVRFYEGAEGLEHILSEIVNNESFDAYFNPEVAYNAFPQTVDDFLKNGDKKSLPIRELIVQSTETKKYIQSIKNPNHQYKILPKKFRFNTDNFVFGNKVAFISYLEGSIAVVIESEDIARSQKMAFELMWSAL